ncbi:MAG: DUF4037 domain-containing protein [Clostridia bacterium]|nr:DUF4037 domain-containing protein [Clostridia bacterium]
MKGLELSRQFYNEYGKPLLEQNFPHLLPFIAVGLAGSGSECYGFDDSISQDHDLEPAFCIFLPDEEVLSRKDAFELERAYAKLPKEFLGFSRSGPSAVGGARHGVIRISDFLLQKTGTKNGELSIEAWFSVPEYSLLEAVNGEIFFDNYGLISAARQKLAYFPEDVRLKKLCGHLLLMGQSGQYNYHRCIKRGDTAAAQLAVIEFTKSAMQALFLQAKKYMPYYKWSFHSLKEISPQHKEWANMLEFLISSGNDNATAQEKCDIIEKICEQISLENKKQGLCASEKASMEEQAYLLNMKIKDNEIRNLHILCGV